MESIRDLYRVGHGPSSSHTMGPRRAAQQFRSRSPEADRYEVTLFASLAATGKGHLTDRALEEVFSPTPLLLHWLPEDSLPAHPNGMRFEAFRGGERMDRWEVYSVGGGKISDRPDQDHNESVYPHASLEAILSFCRKGRISLWEYVEEQEGSEIEAFLAGIWSEMQAALRRGLDAEGTLPGILQLRRQAPRLYRKARLSGDHFRRTGFLAAYAHAVTEENASGGRIVTAPTCGACGVVPATLRYLAEILDCNAKEVLRALATAGLIGNLVKTNASISGAEVGCQGEVGTACSMAAAAAAQLLGGSPRQIEYAAEMGMEHHLGLTCDPVAGLVQIPCIERNAHAATRALTCADYAIYSDGSHRVPFDVVIAVMRSTGRDLPSLYRETSSGGLARALSGSHLVQLDAPSDF